MSIYCIKNILFELFLHATLHFQIKAIFALPEVRVLLTTKLCSTNTHRMRLFSVLFGFLFDTLI